MPPTGRPAAVQAPSPAGAGGLKGVNGAGVGRGTGVLGTCEVEVVVAGMVVVVVVGARGGLVPDRPEDVACAAPRTGVPLVHAARSRARQSRRTVARASCASAWERRRTIR